MEPITTYKGKTVALPAANVDTDQIIPARYLKGTAKELGGALFADWRFEEDGSPKAGFVLNLPGAKGASIMVAGDNFGCGSSREHAPWALVDWGIRALVSTSFADIFQNNALKNGLLPIVVDGEVHREAMAGAEKFAEVAVDLPAETLTLASGRRVEFTIDPFAKRCLVEGIDQMGYLQSHAKAIAAYEERRGSSK